MRRKSRIVGGPISDVRLAICRSTQAEPIWLRDLQTVDEH
jgi:hypothetical protein